MRKIRHEMAVVFFYVVAKKTRPVSYEIKDQLAW